MPKSAAPPKLPLSDMVCARSPQVMRLAKVTYDERSPRFLLHLQALDHPSRRNWTTVERICSEMTTTEKDYVSDITALIERFLDPLAAFADRFCKTKEELPAFTEVRCSAHFILGVHKELYKLMEPPQRRFFNFSNPNTTGSGSLEAVTRITKAFTYIIDYMKVYAIYCANFLPATEELKSHAELLDAFRLSQSDDSDEPPFDVSDLIKPVQRICRYSLLLRSLVKNATSEEEEDLAQQALESMQQVADLVNARVRDAENNVRLLSLNDSIDNSKLSVKMQLLRPGRTLLCEMPAAVQVMDRRARLARALHLRIMKQQNGSAACQQICERASVNSEMELLGGDNSESERETSALRESLTSNGQERGKDRQRIILLSDVLLVARRSNFRLRVRRYICLSCATVVEADEDENEVTRSSVSSKSFALLASKTGSCNCHNLSPSTLKRPVRRRYSLSRSTSLDGELLGESSSTVRNVPRTARQYIVHCETEEKKKEFVKLLRDAINRNGRSAEPRRSFVSVAATNLSAKLWQSMKLRNFSHTLAMRLLHRGTSTTSLDCQDEEINGSTDESNSEEPHRDHSERLLRSSRLATSGAA